MICAMLLFMCFNWFIPFKEKKILKSHGWLYFISHYQLFFVGLFLLCHAFLLIFRGIILFCFYFQYSSLFLASLFSLIIIPFALDCMYYGVFHYSFFIEKFMYKNKDLMGPRQKSIYSFLKKITLSLFGIISVLFLFFSYLGIIFSIASFFWCLLSAKGLMYFVELMIFEDVVALWSFIFFIFPLMLEIFSYAFLKKSYFAEYSDI